MNQDRRVLVFAKEKPGLDEAVSYIRGCFTDVRTYIGNVGDPFPEEVYGMRADICISYMSPWIIPARLLDETREFSINFHPGPPEYPGIGCTNFAIYDGAAMFGITAHLMASRVDTGEIVMVGRFPIKRDDSVYSLTLRCYDTILETFREVFDHYMNKGRLPRSGEKWMREPYTRRELNELCKLMPSMDEAEMRRRIRAAEYPEMPGAYLEINGIRFVPEKMNG